MSRTRQLVCRRFAFRGIMRATNKLDFVASSPSKTRIPIQIRFPAVNTQRRNHAIRSRLVRERRWQTRTYVRSSRPALLLSLPLRQDSFGVRSWPGRSPKLVLRISARFVISETGEEPARRFKRHKSNGKARKSRFSIGKMDDFEFTFTLDPLRGNITDESEVMSRKKVERSAVKEEKNGIESIVGVYRSPI